MAVYEPYIGDPAHLNELAGWHFVVLRAPPSMSDEFRRIQQSFRERLDGQPVSYPARAHVTLAGFAPGASSAGVQDIVTQWARSVTPLRIGACKVATFPSPFQIVIVEVRKTATLERALSSLRAAAAEPVLGLDTAITAREWTFHLSVAYCRGAARDFLAGS
jgi:2'-5' RNA ligase